MKAVPTLNTVLVGDVPCQTVALVSLASVVFKEKYPLMPSWKEALNNIHLGNDNNILEDSSIHLLRLAYDEILANQLSLEIIRNSINKEKSNNYNKESKHIISKFINCLEFNLTIDQKMNVDEIIKFILSYITLRF